MKAGLCVFGLILTCFLHLFAGIPLQPDFNYQKVEGIWHRMAMALKGPEAEVVGQHIRITPLPIGELIVQQKIQVLNTCSYVKFLYRPLNTPGIFTTSVSSPLFYIRQSFIRFVETDYESYLILHIQTRNDTGLYLYGRTFNMFAATTEKFDQHVKSLGFSNSNILHFYRKANKRCVFRTGYV